MRDIECTIVLDSGPVRIAAWEQPEYGNYGLGVGRPDSAPDLLMARDTAGATIVALGALLAAFSGDNPPDSPQTAALLVTRPGEHMAPMDEAIASGQIVHNGGSDA